MKKLTLFLAVLLVTGTQLFSQVLNCTISKQVIIAEKVEASEASLAGLTLCSGQTATFCTEAVAGATYSWSVTGGSGIQINGSTTGSCVSVSVNSPGTYKLCVSKVVNGYEPCCTCVDITCGILPPPCPALKIVVAGTNSPDGVWDYDCPYNCHFNRQRFDVVCIDGSSINNWIYSNGLTGEIKWELTSGNFLFSATLNSCANNPACENYSNCDIRPIVHGAYMQSSWICACRNLAFWENLIVKATITLRQSAQVVLSTTLIQGVHLNHQSTGCLGGIGGDNPQKTISSASELRLFPNPANEKVTIEFNLAEKAKAEAGLYDAAGNKILSFNMQKNLIKGKHQFSVNTKQLRDKLYFVVLKINDIAVMRESLFIE
jgi:hypothetical protein